eukprot:Ihof_evm1s1164 gene=Ihof_evmTU1s1164
MTQLNTQAEKYKNEGNEFFKAGDYMKAIESYTFSIEIDAKNPAYWNNRAAAYLKTGDHPKALRDATKATTIDPGWDKGHWRRGTVLLAMGENTSALECFKKALDISPSTASYKRDYASTLQKVPACDQAKLEGNTLFKRGNFHSAMEKYEEALTLLNPSETDMKANLYNNIAACCLQQECFNMDKVIEATTNALEFRPNDAKALLR